MWPSKDPNEVLDYQHDWSARLDGDTLDGPPECIVESGDVTVDSTAATGAIQTTWLSGGTLDGEKPRDVKLTLRVNTVGGRTLDEGIKLKIKAR